MVTPDFCRGQVWEYVAGSQQYRVVLISGDEYNAIPKTAPWGLVIQRQAPAIPDYLIELTNADPLSGAAVVVPTVLRCQPTGLVRPLGFLSEDTMNTVERALREFLTLP